MECQQSSLDNENKRRRNPAEKTSDASPSERLQQSRNSHLIGSGKNPREWSNQQVGTDETREKKAITTPLDGTSAHSSTQGRNEKRQLSALEVEQLRKWSKTIPLDEYGRRAPKTIELTSVATRDNQVLVGGVNWKFWEGVSSDQTSETDEWIGKRLGQYKLVEPLGEGSFGRVYLGEHIRSKKQAAVKVLLNQANSKLVEEFHKEADVLKRIRHPHIVRGLESGKKNGVDYLVMEYAPKGTLRKAYPRDTCLSLDKVVQITNDLADALDYLHNTKMKIKGEERTLMHLDLKPENVLLGAYGQLLLSDFGTVEGVHSTASQVIPESRSVPLHIWTLSTCWHHRSSPKSDQYALAVMVYEWFSGNLPFQGNLAMIATQHLYGHRPDPLVGNMPNVLPELHQKIHEAVFKALEKDGPL